MKCDRNVATIVVRGVISTKLLTRKVLGTEDVSVNGWAILKNIST